MSGDEFVVLLVCISGSAFALYRWYARIAGSRQFSVAKGSYALLMLAPLLASVGIWAVLKTLASFDVRSAPQYLLLYSLMGIVWYFGAVFALQIFGISFRDDAVERRNPAAILVISGALLAHAAINAGANIGDGPGWWTVVWAGGIGSLAWFALWGAMEACCGVAEKITVGRDVPAAIRLSGYGLALGLICARGSAGDWTSAGQTVAEFAAAWPIVPLTLVAIAAERFFPTRKDYSGGIALPVLIAAAYLAAAAFAVQAAGPLPENPIYDGARPSAYAPGVRGSRKSTGLAYALSRTAAHQ